MCDLETQGRGGHGPSWAAAPCEKSIAHSWEPLMKLIIMVENQPINVLDINLYSKRPKE